MENTNKTFEKITIKKVQKLFEKDNISESTASRYIRLARDILGKTDKQILTEDDFLRAHGLTV